MNRFFFLLCLAALGCSKKKQPNPPAPPAPVNLQSVSIDGLPAVSQLYGVKTKPDIQIAFTQKIDLASLLGGIKLTAADGSVIDLNFSKTGDGMTIAATPAADLKYLTKYILQVNSNIRSQDGSALRNEAARAFVTRIDSSDKFSRVSDEALLTLIQKQTFKYFWDFGHPVSGMARERNTSGDVVTTGGTGFGVMSIIVGIERGFIERQEGLDRISRITRFLIDKCERYHGAFAHWINGATGATVPFSAKDNGGDLVETSLLMQGLLTAREYFSGDGADAVQLRKDINDLWRAIEWDWYRNGQNVLFWHWSKEYNFEMNLKIRGWNESLITYVLAASSPTHPIAKAVYTEGWAGGGAMRNGNNYYGVQLPLGPAMGGPLFFAHYSFLGLDPRNLKDEFADYFLQNKAHTEINYNYCVDNPKFFYGYSTSCWGLTASDDNKSGYMAHSPTNDDGVISPTAAVSSLPYRPEESMNAIRFFYYTLGDKLFRDYGFVDAFNLSDIWFSNSFLAIDQGPQIVMIENYRSGLIWNLFMSCPEIKQGLARLGFTGF